MSKRILNFQTPLSEKLLFENNFFDLYPFDGGGCFIHHEILGSLDDEAICKSIIEKNVMKAFGAIRDLDFTKFAKWGTIELDCWLNRMYFIVPLAKCGNDRMAMDIVLNFSRKYSAPRNLDEITAMTLRVNQARNERDRGLSGDDSPTEYQWYDFQPASRIINTLNAMCFVHDSKEISASEWEEFDSFIRANGEVIFLAERFVSKLEPGNHQMLRGLALLYAGCFLCEKEWTELGAQICSWHMIHDYLADGMLHEISPSYHVFETWMCRDTILLSEHYGFELENEAVRRYKKACSVCRILRQPDGLSFVINDGYPLNMDAFLSTIPDHDVVDTETFLPDAGLAVTKSKNIFVLLDCSPMPGMISHYHGGKNSISLWFRGVPFVVDSGNCSYDDSGFRNWYKHPEAHSSLLVNGIGDSTQIGNCGWKCGADVKLSQHKDGTLEGSLTTSNWNGIVWKRSVTVSEDGLVIQDTVSERAGLEFIFILHPDVMTEIKDGTVILRNDDKKVTIRADLPVEWRIMPGKIFKDFSEHNSQRLCAAMNGNGNVFTWKGV